MGTHADEPETSALSANERADFVVFALCCSKCHSLARPLNSGIDRDDYWKLYVERMRRQPGSGISVADTVPILRFLHIYSLDEQRRKNHALGDRVQVPASAAPHVLGPRPPEAEQQPGDSFEAGAR